MVTPPRPRPVTDGEQLELAPTITCRSKRCAAEVPVQVEGIDATGRPLLAGTCPTCGRVTEQVDQTAPARFHQLELPL